MKLSLAKIDRIIARVKYLFNLKHGWYGATAYYHWYNNQHDYVVKVTGKRLMSRRLVAYCNRHGGESTVRELCRKYENTFGFLSERKD